MKFFAWLKCVFVTGHTWGPWRPMNRPRVWREPDSPYLELRHCTACGIHDGIGRIHDPQQPEPRSTRAC